MLLLQFVFNEKEWITEKSNIGTIPGLHKNGEKVNIVYEIDNPQNFYIKNNKTYSVPYIIIGIASILIIAGVLKLLGLV